jgi:hypothetical protein
MRSFDNKKKFPWKARKQNVRKINMKGGKKKLNNFVKKNYFKVIYDKDIFMIFMYV